MKVLLLLVALLYSSGFAVQAGELSTPVGDRLLIEIDGHFFSQYQLESYFLIKSGLSEQSWRAEYSPLTAELWPDLLNKFVIDMTIRIEAQRLGSFLPVEDLVRRSVERLIALAKSDRGYGAELGRLKLEKTMMVRTVSTILQVAAYRSGRVGGGDGGSAAQDSWQRDLLGKVVVRYLDGSKIYRPLVLPASVKG